MSAAYDASALYRALRPHVRWDLSEEELVREAVANGEGSLTEHGALSVMTGQFTGRSPLDKYTVRREPSAEHIDWTSRFNHSLAPEQAEALTSRFVEGATSLPRLYGFRGYVGRGAHQVPIALITETAWHSLMGRHMLVRPDSENPPPEEPEFTLLYTPSQCARPESDGTRSETVILCDLERHVGVIGGTRYGGEEKKFFFYLLNYLLPLRDAFPMHCSANIGSSGDVSVIFGLSGTGKTTLSADPERRLIGDDEHGWDDDGVFNFEGGCYAKLIRLSQTGEPLIWDAVHRPNSILENVPLVQGVPDFNDPTVENTRGVYPLTVLPDVELDGMAGHANTIVYLTFDASGTLPPVSVLTEEQALYWFLAGYTAKVAGTERGLGTKPEPTFSACFGAPFLPWHPKRYVELLRDKIRKHQPLVVLMNTGAIGGPYGAVGERTPLAATRSALRGAQSGALRKVAKRRHSELGLWIPEECPGVPATLLDPRHSWKLGEAEYSRSVTELASAFHEKVNQVYAGVIDQSILEAGPRLP
jgi:phosphoenolpyruvate carboxykinase (ATP)